VIYIIPVAEYKQLWEDEGDPGVSIALETLEALLDDPPDEFPTAGIPVLPFEELTGTNDLAVQGDYIELGSVDGVRFVGRLAPTPTAVSNEGLQYIFQGFAGDEAEYLVVFFYPVATPTLPDSGAEISAADMDSLAQNPEAYLEAQAAELNDLGAGDWVPSLEILDQVIVSLSF
jgi:hypothetical protein